LNWITGEEDGVDNSDVDSSKLYTQPEEAYAYEELSKISLVLQLPGNVHGVYKPGNVKLTPKILKILKILFKINSILVTIQ
jgi:fructose-bisphosphate aldolase class II